jgi:hypothetical protein
MNIPQYEFDPLVELENGYLTPRWSLFITQLVSQLTTNVGPQGFVISALSADDIADIKAQGLANPDAVTNGTVIYDTTNNLLKIWIVNDFKTILTS